MAVVAAPSRAAEGDCESGLVGIGVGLFQCPGGICLKRPESPNGQRGVRWQFSVEPRLFGIDADIGRGLADGDRLVSVGGLLVTSPEGGVLLGTLSDGQHVEVVVRRPDGLHRLLIEARTMCSKQRLVVTSTAGEAFSFLEVDAEKDGRR